MALRKLGLSIAVVGLLALILLRAETPARPLALTIVHTNDTHANHEPQSRSGEGGDARAARLIGQLRQQYPNTILLDAGDRFTGTLFQRYYKGLDNLPVMNYLRYDAFTLGNHEFDEGDAGLAKFLDGLDCPVVCANIDVSKARGLAGKVRPSKVVRVDGQEIGIIGLTTADTAVTSKPGPNVRFDADYAARVQAEVDRLERQGVNKILVLSHIGLSEDQKLARQVRGVDVIVGGHSHTLLSQKYAAEARGPYPVVETDRDGRPVYIVQAGGGDNRYVGRLSVQFDAQGRVEIAAGDTILLAKDLPVDARIEAEVKRMVQPLDAFRKQPVLDVSQRPVQVAVELPNTAVREAETRLGNLWADAFRSKAGTQVALQGGGGLRTGLAVGPLTVGDIYRVAPFPNVLCQGKLTGRQLRATLEHGLSRFGGSGNGRFLQVSGLRYRFDPREPVGRRLRGVDVLHPDGTFRPLDESATYTIACDSYIRGGGDDFTIVRDGLTDAQDNGPPVQDVVIEYLATHNPVQPALEGRIVNLAAGR